MMTQTDNTTALRTYTWHKLYALEVAVDNETGKVHHAVAGGVTCWPYEPDSEKYGGGYTNASGFYTLKQARGMFVRGTLVFF